MADGTQTKYFNFPVVLLSDFMTNSNEVLDDIFDYAIYSHAQSLHQGNEMERVKATCNFLGVTLGSFDKTLKNGKTLFNSIGAKTPKVGISKTVFFDFYQNEKTEFEKVSLLAFLAIKSIVQNKPYCKVVNKYWLARMAGNSNSCEIMELPEWLKKYSNEYQTKKIKKELSINWGLVTYSRYNRGFYVSFQLKLEDLVYEAEKCRKSTKEKQHKILQNEAVRKALLRLETM